MIRLLAAVVACASLVRSVQADLQIWTASSTVKILKTDAPPKTSQPVKLSAARREVAAFQIAVRSENAVRELRAIGHVRGAKLTVWREHYVKTNLGDRPDPLSPMTAIDVPANTAQPLFVELEVPENAKPGVLTGNIEIHTSNEVSFIPLELTVHDFELPLTPSLRTAFGMDGKNVATFEGVEVGSPAHERLLNMYYELLLSHRISPYNIPVDLMTPEAEKYLDDPRMTSFTIPYPEKDEELKALVDRLRKGGWFKKGYFYVVDEPSTQDAFDQLQKVSDRLKRIVGADYKLVSPYCANPQFKTDKDVYDYLTGKVTIWCYLTSIHYYRTDKLEARRAAGEEIWNYVCWLPQPPPWANFYVTNDAIDTRVLFWQEWKYNVQGLLYWSTNFWSNDGNGTQDPWTDMATVKMIDKTVYGDGSLLYPGKKIGHDGPLPSLRLKLIRQGLQDYEYIQLASERAGRPKTDDVVNSQVESWTVFQKFPERLEDAKSQLTQLIESKR